VPPIDIPLQSDITSVDFLLRKPSLPPFHSYFSIQHSVSPAAGPFIDILLPSRRNFLSFAYPQRGFMREPLRAHSIL
jgi:hypothetical protein